ATSRGADAAHDLVRLGVLEQVADGAGVKGAANPITVREGGEHDDLGRIGPLHDAAGRFDAVDAGHREIHQHDVGHFSGDEADRSIAIAGATDHVDVLLGLEQASETHAQELMVVHERDAGHLVGTSTWIVVPSPTADATDSVPPEPSTRSPMTRMPTWPLAVDCWRRAASNPTPSSRISSTARWSGRDSWMHTWEARECEITLRTASCAARYSKASVSWLNCRSSGRSTVAS